MIKKKWLVYTGEKTGAELNLFCFPYAGGSASIFIKWKNFVDSSFNIYPVQYPFREARRSENMPETVQMLAENFVNDNLELLKSKSFAFFAHCAGASIAYEAAVYISENYHLEPIFMIVSGSEPPHFSLNAFEGMKNADYQTFLKYLIDSHFVSPSVVGNQGFLEYYMPIIREDFRLLFEYKRTEYKPFSFPIYSIVGDNDMVIDDSRLTDWNLYSEFPVVYETVSGGHYYLTENPETICCRINMIYQKYKEEFQKQ